MLLGVSLQGSCVRLNEAHCANAEGSATCRERSPDRPYCSLCYEPGGPDGCTDEPLSSECRADPDSAGSGASTGMLGSGSTDPEGSSSEAGTTLAVDDGAESSSDGELGADVPPSCGDGRVTPGETCDGSDLNGVRSCADIGLGVGVPSCDAMCQLDTSTCCQPNGATCMGDDDCCSGNCDGLLPMVLEGTCAPA
ncbi:MAG: hypothetical protein H6712_08305 [Myxococcales bacterium]|nr:hypothetical protein [Myxococcales bacterium]MCB9713840.1 hypothetical protein [Myxococcales bacterium]